MKISLLSYEFINNDVRKNIGVMIDALKKASEEQVDLIVFGESFIQGFDSLRWNFDNDQNDAIFLSSYEIRCIRSIAHRYHVACAFGYFERFDQHIFSSYLFIGKDGKIVSNYRRRSVGWKEISLCDEHYREGNAFHCFEYEGLTFVCALCGDLWDDNLLDEIAHMDCDILLWPVYVSYNAEQWEHERIAYQKRVEHLKPYVLMVNSYTKIPASLGGSFVFKDGEIVAEGKRGEVDQVTITIEKK